MCWCLYKHGPSCVPRWHRSLLKEPLSGSVKWRPWSTIWNTIIYSSKVTGATLKWAKQPHITLNRRRNNYSIYFQTGKTLSIISFILNTPPGHQPINPCEGALPACLWHLTQEVHNPLRGKGGMAILLLFSRLIQKKTKKEQGSHVEATQGCLQLRF